MRSNAGPDTGRLTQPGPVVMQRRLLSVPAAAERAGVSVKTIRRAYLAGELVCERPGGRRRVLIPEDRLYEWVSSGRLDNSARERPAAAARRDARRSEEPGSLDRLRVIETRRAT
jgi:excisionase family DNA binding protein